MGELLYDRFLERLEEYEQAEQFWRDGFAELVEKVAPPGEWETPWITIRFADGSPFLDELGIPSEERASMLKNSQRYGDVADRGDIDS